MTLQIRNISVVYQQNQGLFRRSAVRAVNDVSLAVSRGETVALVGESGSGKTTLGKAILRLLPTESGSILLDGTDLTAPKPDPAFRRRVQAIFQDPYSSISPYMTVHDIIAEPLVIHRVADREERIRNALEQVHLDSGPEMLARYPHALSGGQRQRVSIARAIVLEPEVIVADEPVSMVDASNRHDILAVLAEIQETRGTAFLYITHDIASTRGFADRIAVMYAGSIVEQGTVDEVLDHPCHPYTKALLASVPTVDPGNALRLRAAVPGEPPDGASLPAGCPFHPRCPEFIPGRCEVSRPPLKRVANTERGSAVDVACVRYQ
jgi:oligopeptide/dipeptide ABC transporter ATP-binding protein